MIYLRFFLLQNSYFNTYFCHTCSWAHWCLCNNHQGEDKLHHSNICHLCRCYLCLGSTDHTQQQYKIQCLILQEIELFRQYEFGYVYM